MKEYILLFYFCSHLVNTHFVHTKITKRRKEVQESCHSLGWILCSPRAWGAFSDTHCRERPRCTWRQLQVSLPPKFFILHYAWSSPLVSLDVAFSIPAPPIIIKVKFILAWSEVAIIRTHLTRSSKRDTSLDKNLIKNLLILSNKK